MTYVYSPARCAFALLFSASLLTACEPHNGRYDNQGNYISDGAPYGASQGVPARNPRKARDNYSAYTYQQDYAERTRYVRPGTYDYKGDYVMNDNPINVPYSMAPVRGMCRIWFTNRTPANQPGVESCDNIRTRVPVGAYVIYGG